MVIGDLQKFLTDLRLWLEQVELGIRSSPSADRAALERSIVDDLAPSVVRAIDTFIERFEAIVGLVHRRDERARPSLLRELAAPHHAVMLDEALIYLNGGTGVGEFLEFD